MRKLVYFSINDIILEAPGFPQYKGKTIGEAVSKSFPYTDSILILSSGNGVFRKNLTAAIKRKYKTPGHKMTKRQKWFVDTRY
jgi:hypothetical protein